jgi:hypothetical protein
MADGSHRLNTGVGVEMEECAMAEQVELDGHHKATLEKIFSHPTSHNIEWHDVLSLLEGVATVVKEHDGRYKVTLGSESETFDAPHHHNDIDVQQVVDLRRMFTSAGITPQTV